MTKKVKEKRGRHLKPKAGLEPGTEKNVTDSPSGDLGRARRTLLKKTGGAGDVAVAETVAKTGHRRRRPAHPCPDLTRHTGHYHFYRQQPLDPDDQR